MVNFLSDLLIEGLIVALLLLLVLPVAEAR